MANAHLTVDDLELAAEKVADFDRPEVARSIEQFTAEELRQLGDKPALIGTLVDDLQKLQNDMKTELVDREEAIGMALACFLAHVNMVFLGPPGTAKSLVVRRLSYGLGLQSQPTSIETLNAEILELLAASRDPAERKPGPAKSPPAAAGNGRSAVGRRYYEVLLTRYSTSDEILGPANLELMIHRAMFYRQTTGLLPEADVAFLDEIWKANSAILNALLSISNEKLFYNAGQPVRVPLCMIFGASNEVPREEELSAMYDRFPIRVRCEPVSNARELLKRSAGLAYRGLFGGGDRQDHGSGVPWRATVNHFRLLHRALYVHFGADSHPDGTTPFARAFCDTFDALKREFQISDRSLHALYRLALARALLRGHRQPQPSELDVFKYCFYEPETAPALGDAVARRIDRYGKFA